MTERSTTASFSDRYRRLLECLPAAERSAVGDFRLVTLPGNRPPWTDTGLEVRKGDAVTLLAAGKVFLSEEFGLWGPPRFHLWGKIEKAGERGTIFNGTRDSFTLAAATDGTLQLGIYQ